MILYDTQHREIKPGARVAFNWSGSVLPGTVKEIRVNRGRKTWIIVQSDLYKKPSKVKRAESMMVIDC